MYFQKIPNIYYLFDIGGKPVLKPVRDITFNVRFRKSILENITLFDEYDIKEGETIEIIANNVYGSPEYHWVIMLCNQKYDYVEDFPVPERLLEQYVSEKYPDPFGIHHYVDSQGFIVSPGTIGAVAITNYDHEVTVNESKRRIKLISPQLLGTILNEYKII